MITDFARTGLAAITLLVASLAGHPAMAQIGQRDVERQRISLDPQRGYVFIRSVERLAGTFLRVPDEQSLGEYRARRDAAFAEAREDYQRRLRGWERRQEAGSLRRNDDRPEEPTDATFSYPSFQSQAGHSFGPDYIYSEDETDTLRYAYLTVLPPGSYVWYGPVYLNLSLGYLGTCYCMGTVAFDVEAGVVTDLGNYLTAAPRFEDHPAVPLERSTFGRFTMPDHSSEVRFGLPPSLAGWPSRRAEFRAVGKINNIYGVRVTRMAPIPGVLGYRRDAVIDERTSQELAPFVLP